MTRTEAEKFYLDYMDLDFADYEENKEADIDFFNERNTGRN